MRLQHRSLRAALGLLPLLLAGCYSLPTYQSVQLDGSQLCYYVLNDDIDPHREYPLFLMVRGSGVSSEVAIKRGLFGATITGALALKVAGLLDQDYLLVALEKRGIPEGYLSDDPPAGFHETNTLDQRVEDVQTGIAHVLDHYNIDRSRVVLFAGSEGGTVAPIVACRQPAVTHLIITGSGGWSHAEEFTFAIENDRLDDWSRGRDGLESRAAFEQFVSRVKASPDSLDHCWGGWPYRRWASFMFHRPIDDLKQLEIPILLLQGGRDTSAMPESAIYVRDVFNELGKPNLTLRLYDDYDHGFLDAQGVGHADELFSDAFAWLTAH